MDNKEFIEQQSKLIDKLLEQERIDRKNNRIKDCVIFGMFSLAIIVFFIGYFFSDYGYSYTNSNNTIENSQQVEMGVDE